MLQAPEHGLAPGDRTPNFVLPDGSGAFTMFYERVQGRPVILLIADVLETPAIAAAADRTAAAGIDVFCIALTPPAAGVDVDGAAHVWSDPKRKVTEALLTQSGLGGPGALRNGRAAALLLDANQRLLAAMTDATAALLDRALAFYGGLAPPPAGQVRRATAPVLVMPRLLDPAMCRGLIEVFETGAVEEGAVRSVLDGKQVSRLHHARKKRLDHKIMDPKLNLTLQQVIGRRAAPEMSKAFNFQGFKFDRFLVCRYAADREDRFRTHRDNLSPSTADRRFAMTLNLNGDDYEGGELVFPEYGTDRYKPGDGGAVIFSCSLLHEALPVVRGVRYALLTFMRSGSAPQAGP